MVYSLSPSPKKAKVGSGKVLIAVITLAFVSYLFPGVLPKTSSNSLQLLAGFPPPTFYSIYPTDNDCPLNLDCYKDFDAGVSIAQETNKPILLDFTGWACVQLSKGRR